MNTTLRTSGLALLAVSWLAVAAPAQQAPVPPVEVADLSPLLARVLEAHDVPALGCATLRGGRLDGLGAAGVRRRGSDAAVETGDLWHLGSCTKAMTATLIALLVEQRALSWETTLAEALPDVEVHEDLRGATVRQLLGHQSGLMRGPMVRDLWLRLHRHEGPVQEARRLVLDEVLPLRPACEPGTRHLYSNTGYIVAGAIAERLSGKSWEELMRARVFAPLGMSSAGFGAPGRAGALDQPRGHQKDGAPVDPGPGSDNPPALGPAGTVHATLEDWARFAALHLRGARGERDLLLRPASFAELHRPVGRKREYALGWGVTRRAWADGPVLAHDGSNTMWYCRAVLVPREDLAVLVTCNQGAPSGRQAVDAATQAVLRHLGQLAGGK